MLKMQTANGGVYHKVSCYNFPGYVMPENEVAELVVTPVSTTSTADFCASMALAYEFYKDIDQNFADTCMEAAKKAWNFLEENPNIIFKNPEEVTTGEYGDTLDGDERYWAGLQMYRATGDTTYLEKVNGMAGMFKRNGLDWSTVGDYGNIAILTMDGVDTSSTAYTNAKKQVITQADSFKKNVNKNPYGSPIVEYNWGSNMTIANAGIILGLAYQVTGDESYQVASEEIINHLLGLNPNATCYMTGYGTVSPQNPHHRPSMAMKKAMPGMLVGGVNSNLEDSAAKAYCKNSPAAKCYIDNSESYSTNEITIYWNSPLTYLLALAEVEAETTDIVKGDADANGKFEVTDIVMVQRYLLNTGELTNWKNVDLHEDGRIDGFDLAIMKRMMLK
jgi:endoglucanase